MEQDMMFEPSADLAKSALIDADGYAALYQKSIANPDQFWASMASVLTGSSPIARLATYPMMPRIYISNGMLMAP